MLKTVMIAALAASATLAGVSSASAAEGCGPGGHRGPYGHCLPNRGPVAVVPGLPALGVFYPGRGYWDGHRYWHNRRAYHGGWRYY